MAATRSKQVRCNKCDRKILKADNILMCVKCSNHYHLDCVKLNLIDYKKYESDMKLGKNKWICDFCDNRNLLSDEEDNSTSSINESPVIISTKANIHTHPGNGDIEILETYFTIK